MVVRTWLQCALCGRDTPHDIHCAGHVICDATCLTCGLETKLVAHASMEYVNHVRSRLRSKPERLVRELRCAPLRARTLPRRIVSKPARVSHEIIDVIR